MGAGLKKNGARAFVAVTAVCAALSPAALAAVGGVSAERRDATASRLVRVGDLADEAPIAPRASFRIGSVTKSFLATAGLAAVGEGRLALDDTLARRLPGVLPRLDEGGITVRMLPDHTSGVPDPSPRLLAHPGLFGDGAVTPADLVAKARALPPVAPPGKEFSYSNADYWLLAMILKRATGQSYTEQVEARVLRPLGLTHTVLPADTTSLPSPFMHGYTPRPGKAPLDVSAFNSSWGSSSGGMVSTTGDLDRFASALLDGRLLAPEELAAMKRGVRVPANPMGVSVYGLGLTTLRLPCGATFCG